MDSVRTHLVLFSTPMLAGLPWSGSPMDVDSLRDDDTITRVEVDDVDIEPDNSGHVAVETAAFVATTDDSRREVGGWVGIAVPLDRLWSPRPMVRLHRAIAQDAARTAARGATRAAPKGVQVSPALARACVAAAWRASGLGSMSDLDNMSGRARTAGLLPEARVRVARSWDRGQKLTPTDSDPYRLQDSTSATQWLEGKLTWRLDRLLFTNEEIAVEKIRMQRLQQRAQIAGKVLTTLFEWQRARLTTQDESKSDEERADAWIRMSEAEATLDVLTGGWFSGWLADSAR